MRTWIVLILSIFLFVIWWTSNDQDGAVGASAEVISSESSLDVSKHHLHAFPEPQGLEPPSDRSLALIRRHLLQGLSEINL